jgi:hypothetical protein
MLVISLELVTDPSPWLPLNSSSIGILSTLSREKASPDSNIKSSGMVSKGTAASEPISGTSSTTGSETLEETSLDESLPSQTTSSFRRRIKTPSPFTSTSATKRKYYVKTTLKKIILKKKENIEENCQNKNL